MIDSMVQPAHPSLSNAKLIMRDFASKAGKREYNHATGVASLLIGEDQNASFSGLLPGATLLAANVFYMDDEGNSKTDIIAIAKALDWVASNDVDVINMSITGPPSSILENITSRLSSKGITIVAAVGNDGPAAPPLYPATYDTVLGVTAVDANETVYRRAGRGAQVDFSAPGVNVRVARAEGGYGAASGTSFATPVVTSMFAYNLHYAPEDRDSEYEELISTARDLGPPGRDTIYGYGLLFPSVVGGAK